ncbi:hypothetical protein QT972_08120 [Microcoleus sp. herbarium7]|uniref:hypothetical protein n=1 Tax=Microcoleus sp. herbarium7 TaxID=3055435 RepID=UPI002FD3A8E3
MINIQLNLRRRKIAGQMERSGGFAAITLAVFFLIKEVVGAFWLALALAVSRKVPYRRNRDRSQTTIASI